MSKPMRWAGAAVLAAIAGTAGIWWATTDPMTESAVEHARQHAEPGYTCAMHPQVQSDQPGNCPICGMRLIEREKPTATDTVQAMAQAERKPLYWYDPMRPDVQFDAPGRSPFMDMELVPKYADDSGEGTVTIDARTRQNLGIRLARVERAQLAPVLQAAGSVMVDEHAITAVQARVEGWVERLHVRTVNEAVRRGALLAEIYAPELLSAQEELLLALRSRDDSLVQSARRRLQLLGVGAAQVAQLMDGGKPSQTVRYHAPGDGIVMELGVREGAQVAPGMTLFKLADLARVWITAEVPEAQAGLLREGMEVQAQVAGVTDRSFQGRVEYIYPEVASDTRTLKVRAVLDNPELRLRPGQFASMRFAGAPREALLVPSEAVIRTGTRSVVIVAEDAQRFRPVDVRIGAESAGRSEILSGLEEGQQVVSSGQFLIDSEANLRSSLKRLEGAAPTPPASDDRNAAEPPEHGAHAP